MVNLGNTPYGVDEVEVLDESGTFSITYKRLAFQTGDTSLDETNTGVPEGTSLTVHTGDLEITVANTVLMNLHISGRVKIQAEGVSLVNCLIDGGPLVANDGTSPVGLVECFGDGRSVTLSRCTLKPANPSPALDGVRGWNFTLDRCNVSGTTDGVGVIPPRGSVKTGVVLTGTWIHGLAWWTQNGWRAKTGRTTAKVHPSDTATHNDCVQIHGGSGTRITGCRLDAYSGYPDGVGQKPNALNVVNVCVQLDVAGTLGPIIGTVVENSWLSGGYSALVQAAPREVITSTVLRGNRLTPGNSAIDFRMNKAVWTGEGNTPTPTFN